MKFFQKIIPFILLMCASCASFGDPKTYEDVVYMAVQSGQVVAQFSKEKAIEEEDTVGCVVAETFENMFPLALSFYDEEKEQKVSIPSFEVDISACDISNLTQNPRTEEVSEKIEGILGPILSVLSLYSQEISCEERVVTEGFLDISKNMVFQITKGIFEGETVLLIEGRDLDFTGCQE